MFLVDERFALLGWEEERSVGVLVRTLNFCARTSYVCLQNSPAAGGTDSCSSCQCETCVRLTSAVASMTLIELDARSSRRPW